MCFSFKVPGPPRSFHITNVTNNSCRLLWKEPDSYVSINGYMVRAEILKTFSSYPPSTLEWKFGNSTFQAELPNLLSATKYNISVFTLSQNGNGASAYQVIVTKLGGLFIFIVYSLYNNKSTDFRARKSATTTRDFEKRWY